MDNLNNKIKKKIILEYFLGYSLVYPIVIMIVFGLLFASFLDKKNISLLGNIVVYVIVFGRMIYLAKPMLSEEFEIFRANYKQVLSDSFRVYIKMILASGLINIIIMSITNSSSNNQAMIEAQFKDSPVLIIMVAVIFAPIVEEIVFRGSIFSLLNHKMSPTKSAIISGLLFGTIHVLLSLFTGQFLDLLNIFSYGVMGYFFGIHYYRSKTIFAPMAVHFLNNFVAVLLMMVVS